MLLDFGLITELERREQTATTGNNVVGSVPYMSPEQAAGKRLSRASDWYSVGVMLYEALTGRQPFHARAQDVLSIKQEKDPPPPSVLVAGLPPDLNWLCMGLLRRDPATRPSGDEVLRRLDTGVYVNTLWYLNYSDRPACRITGMTRFATFWVEDGRIAAPLNVMRFDETAYRVLGRNLMGLTAERDFIPSSETYESRSTESIRLPGALVEDFRFTL